MLSPPLIEKIFVSRVLDFTCVYYIKNLEEAYTEINKILIDTLLAKRKEKLVTCFVFSNFKGAKELFLTFSEIFRSLKRSQGIQLTSKNFATIFDGLNPLTNVARHSIFDVCRILNTSLERVLFTTTAFSSRVLST